jgi:hypothetical protein
MALLVLVLLILGLVAFLAATFNVVSRINLIAAGLACWIATAVIQAWPK